VGNRRWKLCSAKAKECKKTDEILPLKKTWTIDHFKSYDASTATRNLAVNQELKTIVFSLFPVAFFLFHADKYFASISVLR
jgi:hypothetical protein